MCAGAERARIGCGPPSSCAQACSPPSPVPAASWPMTMGASTTKWPIRPACVHGQQVALLVMPQSFAEGRPEWYCSAVGKEPLLLCPSHHASSSAHPSHRCQRPPAGCARSLQQEHLQAMGLNVRASPSLGDVARLRRRQASGGSAQAVGRTQAVSQDVMLPTWDGPVLQPQVINAVQHRCLDGWHRRDRQAAGGRAAAWRWRCSRRWVGAVLLLCAAF